VDLHAVGFGPSRCSGEARAEEGDVVTQGGDAAEDLVQVDLRPPGLGVLQILPVDDEDLQEPAPTSAMSLR
jgi:hypothetical protein